MSTYLLSITFLHEASATQATKTRWRHWTNTGRSSFLSCGTADDIYLFGIALSPRSRQPRFFFPSLSFLMSTSSFFIILFSYQYSLSLTSILEPALTVYVFESRYSDHIMPNVSTSRQLCLPYLPYFTSTLFSVSFYSLVNPIFPYLSTPTSTVFLFSPCLTSTVRYPSSSSLLEKNAAMYYLFL